MTQEGFEATSFASKQHPLLRTTIDTLNWSEPWRPNSLSFTYQRFLRLPALHQPRCGESAPIHPRRFPLNEVLLAGPPKALLRIPFLMISPSQQSCCAYTTAVGDAGR